MKSTLYPRTALGRYWLRVKTRIAKKPVSTPVISLDDRQFTLNITYVDRPTERIATAAWTEVESIRVYKRDLLAYDLICMEFEIKEDRHLELHEEMEGWESLITRMPEFLPGCSPQENWWLPVAVPAFETNLRQIYRRSNDNQA